METGARSITPAVVFLMCFATAVPWAVAQTPALETLYEFKGTPDASYPYSALVVGGGEELYGTTLSGGTFGKGAVFSLAPPTSPGGAWTETVLHSFGGPGDGINPQSAIALISGSGVLYGTTAYGGTGSCQPGNGSVGCGTVFRLTPPATPGDAWTETVLHHFAGGSDGAYPFAGLATGREGVLYGVTGYGGTGSCGSNGYIGCGTVFSLTPSKTGDYTEKVLYTFTGFPGDGEFPQGSLAIRGGVLYGTTGEGGTSKNGTVFSLAPPASLAGAWTETVLHNFAGYPRDGGNPFAGIAIGGGGVLYGTTYNGGAGGTGTLFSLSPPVAGSAGPWTEALLHQFSGPPDGANPAAGVVIAAGGVLYGSTTSGGTGLCQVSGYCGTVFSLTPPASPDGHWSEGVLHNFFGKDGDTPLGGVVIGKGGVLYGATTPPGTGKLLYGTVFMLTP